MKERDLFKQVADKQMPDLEAIRQNCINQTKPEAPSKVIKFKTSKFIAIAATVAIVGASMVAVFANQGGVFFPTESTAVETAAVTMAPKVPAKEHKASKTDSKTDSQSSTGNRPQQNEDDEEAYIDLLKKHGYSVTIAEKLGETGGYTVCYATDSLGYSYDADYIIGRYVFSCETQRTPYGAGIFVFDDESCYTLAEAYRKEIFSDFDDVVKIINKSEVQIDVSEESEENELFTEYLGRSTIELARLGEYNDCELFYELDGELADSDGEQKLGDFELSWSSAHKGYAPGFYALYDGEVYTLAQAVENELIEPEKAAELVNNARSLGLSFSFSMTKDEPAEETDEATEETAPQTEETTE